MRKIERNTRTSTRQLALAALLLALCVGAQQFKALSQFITGPIVNAVLILAVLLAGLWGALAIAVLSPALAFLIAPAPVLQAVPHMLPLIALANVVLVLCVWLPGKKHHIPGVAAGVALKPLLLFLGVRYAILPFFAAGLPERLAGALMAAFSINQLITAAIGGVLACGVYRLLPKNLRS